MLQHSRTPGVVLMVLVICYCAIPPVSTYAYGQDSGSTFYCPYRHVVKEETQILEASVVEVETKPISVVSLRTATYTTTTTLTAITHLSRTVTIHRPNVQIVHSVVVTSPQHITRTEVSTVPWTITFTTTALTTAISTRLLHTTTTFVPPRLPPVTSTSTLVLEQPVTSLVPSVSYVTPVETVVEFLTKIVTTRVVGQAPAVTSTRTITDTIVFTVITTTVTYTLNDVKVMTSTIQITQMALTTVTITHTAPGNTVVLYGSPATLVVTETQVQRNTVELLQPYVTLAVAPVTTTMLDSTTVTSTNTLEFIVTKTRAWHVTAHQKVYRSTLAKITQETHQIPECSMDVKKTYTHAHTHAYAHSTTDVTSTIKVVTTTTSYIMETFTTTLLGEGASQCPKEDLARSHSPPAHSPACYAPREASLVTTQSNTQEIIIPGLA
ncbi:hypothetical protein O3P69_017964 [Scylla paramamosain]|uniref:Uncharacterized protein n=1 Tax=Scylla paramamosain TaxID=85552 RepID=A0AAW0TKC4_SCYPA